MHAIARVLFECEHCGKCCSLTREYTLADVDRIEQHTGEDRETIKAKLEMQTCGYLTDNICSIHLVKPSVCKWWPGPGAMNCPGYKRIVDKYSVDMHKICSDTELSALYIRCVLHNDKDAARAILDKLNMGP